MPNIEKKLTSYKTICCDSEWYAANKLDFRCKKCDEDVTIEIICLYEILQDDKSKDKQKED